MSAVNYGEAYYSLTKLIGTKRAEIELEIILTNTPLRIISAAPEHAARAARLKAQYGLPYADAFAAELALPGGIVVTTDADHFRRIPKLKLLALPRA